MVDCNLARRRNAGGFWGVCLLVTGLLLTGCNNSSSSSQKNVENGAETGSEANMARNALLDSALSLLDVQSLGIDSDPESAIGLINQAYAGSQEELKPKIEAAQPAWKGLLSTEEAEVAARQDFPQRDGLHIWDALLSRDIGNVATAKGDSEIERINAAFNHVVRNLTLVPRHPNELPLTLEEVWMLGKGTVSDRAWAFAEILRQLGIDSVLLTAAEPADDDAAMMVGVLLDGEVYLFDPRLGVAVPGKSLEEVATLSQVIADPTLLEVLQPEGDRPAPLSAEALKKPRVLLIGDTSYWAPRLQMVEAAFVGDDHVRLYDGLHDEGQHLGLVSRVAEAGGENWDRESIQIWNYPEQQLSGRSKLSVSQRDTLRGLKDSWRAGWEKDQSPQAAQGGFTPYSLFAARVSQLTGEYARAIKLYVRIGKANRDFQELQSGKMVPHLFPENPNAEQFAEAYDSDEKLREANTLRFEQFHQLSPGDQRMVLDMLKKVYESHIRQHRVASQDAAYWIGICQYEQEKLSAASNTFQLYLQKNPQGAWASAARYHLALAQAAEGDLTAAAQTLSATSENDPDYDGHQALRRIWMKQAAAAKTE